MPDMLPNGTPVIEAPKPPPEAPPGYPYLKRTDCDIFYIWTPQFASTGTMLPATKEEYRAWLDRTGRLTAPPPAPPAPTATTGTLATVVPVAPPPPVADVAAVDAPVDQQPPEERSQQAQEANAVTPFVLPTWTKATQTNADGLRALVLMKTGKPADELATRADMLEILYGRRK